MKSTESEIAVLQTQMTAVQDALAVIKSDQRTNFQALAVKIDNLANTPLEINSINARLNSLERAKAKDWIWKTLSGAAGAVLATLILLALRKGNL